MSYSKQLRFEVAKMNSALTTGLDFVLLDKTMLDTNQD